MHLTPTAHLTFKNDVQVQTKKMKDMRESEIIPLLVLQDVGGREIQVPFITLPNIPLSEEGINAFE